MLLVYRIMKSLSSPIAGFYSHGRRLVAKRNHPAIPEIDPVSSASPVFPPDDLGDTDVRHGEDPETFARHQRVDDPSFGRSQAHDRLGMDVQSPAFHDRHLT